MTHIHLNVVHTMYDDRMTICLFGYSAMPTSNNTVLQTQLGVVNTHSYKQVPNIVAPVTTDRTRSIIRLFVRASANQRQMVAEQCCRKP